jgi:hypothetical protein
LEPLFAAFSAQLTHADLGCRWLRRHVCNLGAAQHFSHGRLPRAQEGKRVQLLADSKWCSSAFYGPLVDWGCMGPAQRLVKVTSDDALRYLRAHPPVQPPPTHTHHAHRSRNSVLGPQRSRSPFSMERFCFTFSSRPLLSFSVIPLPR